MSTRRIETTITKALCFIIFMSVIVACDNGQGMMHENGSMGTAYWNWGQILIGLGLGFLIGFLVGYVVSKRK